MRGNTYTLLIYSLHDDPDMQQKIIETNIPNIIKHFEQYVKVLLQHRSIFILLNIDGVACYLQTVIMC